MDCYYITVSDDSRDVIVSGVRIKLTPIELGILSTLLANPETTLSRQELLYHASGHDCPSTERAIDVHVAHLRRKLGMAGKRIETIRGQGYRFAAVTIEKDSSCIETMPQSRTFRVD